MSQLKEFLEILEKNDKSLLDVETTSKGTIKVKPLSFKQQKNIITTSLDGVTSAINFIKILNDVILENTKEKGIKIYDRVPIILALKKELSSKNLIVNGVEISINELISNYKPFNIEESKIIEGDGFKITLRIPTLEQDNYILNDCIQSIKELNEKNLSGQLSLILTYEIPKFIESISFGDNVISVDSLTLSDRKKIVDNIPANITNDIIEYIIKVKEYDESLLTINDITIQIDTSFFE